MAASIRRDSATGGSLESFSRWRNRRGAMPNVMAGVRASDLRGLNVSLNHVVEHDTNERTVADNVTVADSTDSSNVGSENAGGLAAVLGFPLNSHPASSSPINIPNSSGGGLSSDSGEDSSLERERIIGSPVHKRRRNALANALAVVDEDSLHRIQRLHNATHHNSHHHERW